jgi:hypothetical protein
MPLTIKEQLIQFLQNSPQRVFLRADFAQIGNYRQVSRALREAEHEGALERCGHGIFRRKDIALLSTDLLAEIRGRLNKRAERFVSINDTLVHIKPQVGRRHRNKQALLDEKKLRRAKHLLNTVPLPEIRRVSLATLKRWRKQQAWCSAYGEWETLMRDGSDQDVIAVMTGQDENANRLRQSPPYAGFNHIIGEQHDARPT